MGHRKDKETVEIEIPSKSIRVKNAMCQNGHSLMDDEHRIDGYPSVTALVKTKDSKGLIHLDPVYGSYKNVPEIEIPEGECVELFCPTCGVSLTEGGQICDECLAPMFTIHLPHGGVIDVCTRNGCQFHNLKFTDSKEMGQKLMEDHFFDSIF